MFSPPCFFVETVSRSYLHLNPNEFDFRINRSEPRTYSQTLPFVIYFPWTRDVLHPAPFFFLQRMPPSFIIYPQPPKMVHQVCIVSAVVVRRRIVVVVIVVVVVVKVTRHSERGVDMYHRPPPTRAREIVSSPRAPPVIAITASVRTAQSCAAAPEFRVCLGGEKPIDDVRRVGVVRRSRRAIVSPPPAAVPTEGRIIQHRLRAPVPSPAPRWQLRPSAFVGDTADFEAAFLMR